MTMTFIAPTDPLVIGKPPIEDGSEHGSCPECSTPITDKCFSYGKATSRGLYTACANDDCAWSFRQIARYAA